MRVAGAPIINVNPVKRNRILQPDNQNLRYSTDYRCVCKLFI